MIDLRKPQAQATVKKQSNVVPTIAGIFVVIVIMAIVCLTSFDCLCFTR